MQSSPPSRGSSRDGHSPTQYSVDFSALETASRNGQSPSIPHAQVDHITSEDLDGPSDFTLNMEQWMRDGYRSKFASVNFFDRESGSGIREDFQSFVDERTLSTIHSQPSSHHTPTRTPPRASLGTLPCFSTDCSRSDNADRHAPRATMKASPDAVEERSQDTPVSPQVAVMADLPSGSKNHEPYITSCVAQQLKELRERCVELERLNQTLTETMENQVQLWQAERVVYETRQQEAYQREQDLLEMKRVAGRHMEAFRDEFAQQNLRLRDVEDKCRNKQAELEDTSRQLRESRRIQGECSLRADQHFEQLQELRLLRKDSDPGMPLPPPEEKNARDDSKEDSFKGEIARLRKVHSSTFTKLASEIESLRSRDVEQQSIIQVTQATNSHTMIQLSQAQFRIEALEEENDRLKQHANELMEQLADHKSTSALLDARMCEEMKKRDERWRNRFQSSQKERHLMSKALLHQWGNAELGSVTPQMYEYRYRRS